MLVSIRRVCLIAMLAALAAGACQSSPQPIQVVATPTLRPPPTQTPRPTPTPAPTRVPYRDTIVIGLSQEPRTLNPLTNDDPVMIHILDAIYERYITSIDFAYQANPNGGLLDELPTLENGGAALDDGGTPADPRDDQLTMVFKLRPGPTWCDGTPVTARDSVYAFNLARDPDSGAASRIAIDRVESYTARDDYAIEVKLKPGQLDPAYSTYFWSPLPEHLWNKYTALELQTAAESTRRLCGYGPYTIMGAESKGAGWIAGDSITLAANPHYFRGAPKTPRLVFKFIPNPDERVAEMLAGKLDLVTSDGLDPIQLPQYLDSAGRGLAKVVTTRNAAWEQLVFNLNAPTSFDSKSRAKPHPILSDVRVRRAIAYAIDRPALIERLYAGRSIVMHEALVYPNHPLYTPEDLISVYSFDPDRAGALLDEAGWTDKDGSGVRKCQGCASGAKEDDPLKLTYRTTGSPLRDLVVDQVQRDLNAVGFDITVELQPKAVFFGDVTGLIVGDFELGQLSGLTDVDPGGERQYGCDWIPSPDNGWYGENYSGWCSASASQALFDARRALRLDERRAAYVLFQREFTRELPGLPLFPRLDVFLTNPGLENFKPNDSMPSATWNAFQLRVPNR